MTTAASLSYAAARQGDRAATRAWLVRAAEVGGRAGFPRAAVYLAEVALADGDQALADQRHVEALAVVDSPAMRSGVHQALGASRHRSGRLAEARDHLEQAYGLLVEHGTTNGLRSIVYDLAEVAHEIGDLATQEQWITIGLEIGEGAPRGSVDGYLRSQRARGRLWAGSVAQADDDLAVAEALTAAGSPMDRATVAEVRAQWGWRTGDAGAATAAANHAIAGFSAMDERVAAAYAERHLARVRLAAGDSAGARAHAERAWEGVERDGSAYVVAVVACLRAELADSDRGAWIARARGAHPEAVGALGTELRWSLDRIGA